MIGRLLYTSVFFVPLFCLIGLSANAQEVQVYKKIDGLTEHIEKASMTNTTVVVNFWATWCKPCVDELSAFNTLQQRYAGQQVKVLLVSLDWQSKMDTRLLPFLQANPMTPEVILLADQDADTWIPKIDSGWEGDLPFTVIYKKGVRSKSYAADFKNYTELEMFCKR
jgi:thiol-disulfide isomerase/thioredoxin